MLDDTQLAALHQQLQEREKQLTEVLNSVSDRTQTVALDQQSTGRVSRGDALQQQAMAIANENQYKRELQQVRAALRRMDEDDYGFCDECGEDIPYPRLSVKPEVTLCLNCQSAREGAN
ncbi:TraR/DksA family transcriptional regulator [Tamilnaduibacter salinus]|uniref:Molecular chaperone DnaK n=1 Tax=Tamilnaduibacter salinus TaxID=1484056 RepID=A0A2A2I6Q9_9GAMM|nr:TraR/DksA family transcriptional regulator [Tamilnaduibacter salinus]PAV27429.1 molecular chaperone DnaK [Tamilnaduibacter salinus]PVY75462.1 TraR/DksA family transcriptional regulator [Tamilnaduibacter salinus]